MLLRVHDGGRDAVPAVDLREFHAGGPATEDEDIML